MKKHIISIAVFSLLLLWAYAAASKLLDMDASRAEMLNQVFPKSLALALTWIVPLTELLIIGLLAGAGTRLFGLLFSVILLALFTIYILLVISNAFGFIPCSCAGINKHLDWNAQLIFNAVMLLLAVAGLKYEWKFSKTLGDAENL